MSARDVAWMTTWAAGLLSAMTAAAVAWLLLMQPVTLARAATDGGGGALLHAIASTMQALVVRVFQTL